ncbi:hypothetical protein J2T25_001226 [Citrobacter amalonaticus]|nr:hypothetical protein [Citrobacter amalonaticus]
MLVGHSYQNEVELVLHKHTSSCYMDAELAAIIFIYLLSELTLLGEMSSPTANRAECISCSSNTNKPHSKFLYKIPTLVTFNFLSADFLLFLLSLIG